MKKMNNSTNQDFNLHILRIIFIVGIIILFINSGFTSFDINSKSASTSSTEWDVTLNFDEHTGCGDYVVFSEAFDANEGAPADIYDKPKAPAQPKPYIRAWFYDELPDPYYELTEDCRIYPDTTKEWNLYVMWVPSNYQTSTDINISWDVSEVLSSEYASVVLYDYDNDAIVAEITSDNKYRYEAIAMATHHFQIIATNTPPNIPDTPNPADEATGVSVNADLSWTGGDSDEGDIVTYDVYFGTENSPQKILDNQSTTTHDHGTLVYDTTYYWKIVAWDDHDASTSGPIWSFITESYSSGGNSGNGGGGNGGNGGETVNTPPVANASAGEPYQGFINSEIVFNGTLSYDPDDNGYIKSWEWDFGDETNESGEMVTHSYSDPGTYTVTLTVTDDKDAQDIYETIVDIRQPSIPPTQPVVNGPTSGNKKIEYPYTAVSTDSDNDTIQYVFDWDDGKITTTIFLTNGTNTTQYHSWNEPGMYTIKVKATDNETYSGEAKITVLIDACLVGELGYFVDTNDDGVYDLFCNDETSVETVVEQQESGNYLLDADGDGVWDYTYNPVAGTVAARGGENKRTAGEIQWSFIAILVIALAIIVVIIYFYKKNYF